MKADPQEKETIVFLGKLYLRINFHNHSFHALYPCSLYELDSEASLAEPVTV